MTARGRRPETLLVVGDALLDRDVEGRAARLCPDAPAPVLSELAETVRPGGAGLAALLAALDGREVVLVTALGDDRAGWELRTMLDGQVTVIGLPLRGATREKIRIRSGGQSLVRLDRGDGVAAIEAGPLPDPVSAAVADAFAGAGGVLVSDYGGGVAAHPALRELLCAAARTVPVVWDPHPRGARPVPGVRMATPNIDEARTFAAMARAAGEGDGTRDVPSAAGGARATGRAGHPGLRGIAEDAATLVRAWRAGAVVVTMGPRGALLSYGDGVPLVVPTEPVRASDACGAGDRFAATAAGRLLDGAVPSEATTAAVAAARSFVQHGGAAAVGAVARPVPASWGGPHGPRRRSAQEVVAAVRAAGGTVVATGGCFDLLHAGHVSALRLARELGDCLVVCLNSDASVRRIKGPDRPLVPQEDRVRVLEALACVDAVVVFDEDDPGAVLAELRPDVWAKGGDYTGAELPEAQLVARWGGQVVLLPYLEGRSTTQLVHTAAQAVRAVRAVRGVRRGEPESAGA